MLPTIVSVAMNQKIVIKKELEERHWKICNFCEFCNFHSAILKDKITGNFHFLLHGCD